MDIALGTLPSLFFLLLFNGQNYFDIYHLVEVPHDAIQLRCYITTQSRGNFQMVTADRQIHK
jgi:uncharacterized protein with GYD domain